MRWSPGAKRDFIISEVGNPCLSDIISDAIFAFIGANMKDELQDALVSGADREL